MGNISSRYDYSDLSAHNTSQIINIRSSKKTNQEDIMATNKSLGDPSNRTVNHLA